MARGTMSDEGRRRRAQIRRLREHEDRRDALAQAVVACGFVPGVGSSVYDYVDDLLYQLDCRRWKLARS